MQQFQKIFCFIVFVQTCFASDKTPPLKQVEGPWKIRNASENALPIIGKCPTMNIESSPDKSSSDGIILLKTSLQTLTLSVVRFDQEIYQLYYPQNERSIGNVTVLHVEKSKFFITKLQTEGEIYYAVLTKENDTSADTHKKIEKMWKAKSTDKNDTLKPVENENCSTQEKMAETPEVEENGPSDTSDGSTTKTSTTPIPVYSTSSTTSKSNSSGGSSHKPETSPITGRNDTKKTAMGRGSGTTIVPSYLFTLTSLLFFLLTNNVFIYT